MIDTSFWIIIGTLIVIVAMIIAYLISRRRDKKIQEALDDGIDSPDFLMNPPPQVQKLPTTEKEVMQYAQEKGFYENKGLPELPGGDGSGGHRIAETESEGVRRTEEVTLRDKIREQESKLRELRGESPKPEPIVESPNINVPRAAEPEEQRDVPIQQAPVDEGTDRIDEQPIRDNQKRSKRNRRKFSPI